MDAREERRGVAERLGEVSEVVSSGVVSGEREVEVDDTPSQSRWHPSHQEREAIARLAVLGISPDEMAGKMGKSVLQVRYALNGDKQKEYEDNARENADKWVGFAMAQLQLAAPESVNNALRIVRDPQHRDNARMTIWHLDTVLAPIKQAPEERHDFTINLSKQATEVLMEGLLGYREKRLNGRGSTDSIRGLQQGNEALIDSRVSMEPGENADERIDIDGQVVGDDT